MTRDQQLFVELMLLLHETPLAIVGLNQLPPAAELCQALLDGLRHQVEETGGCRPVLILFSPTPQNSPELRLKHNLPYTQIVIDCAPFMANDSRKRLLSHFGHWLVERVGAVAVMFASEIWMGQPFGPDDQPRTPSEDPQRREGVLIDFEYQPDVRKLEIFPLLRQDNRVRLGEALAQEEGCKFSGRFANWLPVLH